MRQVVWLFVFLVCLLIPKSTNASRFIHNNDLTSGKIVLTEESTVTISAWLGVAACRVGQVSLVSPELKLVSSNKTNEDSKNTRAVGNQKNIIIHNYAKGMPSVEIGPYPAGTEIVLGIQTGDFCNSSHISTDKSYTNVSHNGGGSWTIAWEDFHDMDRNDVYTEITIRPASNIVAKQVFAENPTYKLPYPAGIAHKFTVLPGVGEHYGARAFDIDMKIGDRILASEVGLVLWIEDSFGSGSCDSKNRGSTNVVVIQTEAGVNQTYVHLDQGSVKKAGIKVGDVVRQGQWLGNAGNSGYVCSDTGNGSHLHIEWQHNCYSVDQAKKRRTLKKSKPGEATLAWACPGFPSDSPYSFTLKGKVYPVTKTLVLITSDNVEK